MADVTQYAPVIKIALTSRIGLGKIRLNKTQKEDLTQDCYVALLENQDKLTGPDHEDIALEICQKQVRNILRPWTGYSKPPELVSADDPSMARHLERIAAEIEGEVSESELYQAIDSLPGEEQSVIRSLFIEGLTQAKTAEKLGISVDAMRWRQKCGIMKLRQKFEV
jgi:RNA polymerase sigma factor (sigma-70 family)